MMDQTTEEGGVRTEEHIEKLLEENLELNKENNKILRRMERNALISFFAKIFLWLILLGLPLIFLGPYLKPLLGLLTGAPADPSVSPLGVPSESQLQQLLDTYSGK
jgi:hypothetical protein